MESSSLPTVAAIILNYNYAHYLPQAVESALSQKVPFDEVFVVNDGSTDNSLAILEPYKSRVSIIDLQNSGQLGACLEAIKKAKSDYIYILDADDWLTSDMVAEIKPYLTRGPVKLQFQLYITDADGRPVGSAIPGFPKDYGREHMIKDNKVIGFYICSPTSGNVYRTEVLNRLKLERFNRRDALDGTPAMVMPYFGDVVTLIKPLAFYRVHSSSFSQSLKDDKSILQKELATFHARWAEAETFLGIKYEASSKCMPFFVSERKLMLAAIQNKFFCFKEIEDFVSGLWNTSYRLKQKVVFSIWSFLLCIPIRSFRKKVISYRRAGSKRPEWLSAIIKRINSH